jgi:transposase
MRCTWEATERGSRKTCTVQTTTRALGMERDLLASSAVTIAAMESTSSYWKAPFYCLEEVLEVWLLNVAHMKATLVRAAS